MKKILLIILIIFLTPLFSFGEEDAGTFLTGKIQSTNFLKDANAFVLAIIMGNNTEVKRLLDLGANPNEKYSRVPVIFFTSHLKYDKTMSLLLEYGADPDTTLFKESVLKYSVFRKCPKCTSALVSYGADVDKKAFGTISPIDLALKMKDKDSYEVLINSGAKTTKKTRKLIKKNNWE